MFIRVFCLVFFNLYKECNSYLISLLRFCELFSAFNWDKEIVSLLSICYGVDIFDPCPLSFADSSVSRSGIFLGDSSGV